MSEDRNRGSRDFSRYDSMTTEDLEEILRLDAEAPMEQESDTELILHVMEVLANRRRNINNTGKTAQESWESFQKHYLPAEEELPECTSEAETSEKPAHPWLSRLIAAAAAIVLVLCVPQTAKAFSWEELWNVVTRWARETFSFVNSENEEVSDPNPSYDGEYKSLQDVLRENNRDYSLVPVWIPDGYALEKVEKVITPVREIYRALYIDGDKQLKIRVQTYASSDPYNVEVGEDIIEIYEVSGVDYYIFSNVDQLRFVWTINSYECNVSGNLSLDEAKKMIDSIGKG